MLARIGIPSQVFMIPSLRYKHRSKTLYLRKWYLIRIETLVKLFIPKHQREK